METSLRLLLLLVGLVIVVGIIWDTRRNSAGKQKHKPIVRDRSEAEDLIIEDIAEPEILTENSGVFTDKAEESAPITPSPSTPAKTPEIILLHVMARESNLFFGKALFKALNEAYLYYGDMQIFHRHEETDGSGKRLFSLVSSVEPGYFEAAKREDFKTPGITLFFELIEPNRSIAAFEVMLRTAKQLAMRLDGELRDSRHKPLTIHEIEHYRERVRQQTPLFRANRAS